MNKLPLIRREVVEARTVIQVKVEGGRTDGRRWGNFSKIIEGEGHRFLPWSPPYPPPTPIPSTNIRTGRTGRALKLRDIRQSVRGCQPIRSQALAVSQLGCISPGRWTVRGYFMMVGGNINFQRSRRSTITKGYVLIGQGIGGRYQEDYWG